MKNMSKVLVSGLINIETTLKVDGFPIPYFPVRYPFFGAGSTISGVGWNVAKALTTLGDEAVFVSLIGSDLFGELILNAVAKVGWKQGYILQTLEETPQSVILFDPEGRRQINVDLKDIQERTYPVEKFYMAVRCCELAVMSTINFSRSHLPYIRAAGIPIASDIHTISSLDDAYNRDFMEAADILFCSDECLPCSPEEWAGKIFDNFLAKILVIGMGSKGAFLADRTRGLREHVPAVFTRAIVNTIGAGDALFSGFVHYYMRTKDPLSSLRKAVVFASYKIGERGAAEGFLTESELERWCETIAARSE